MGIPKLAIVIGSVRPNRFAAHAAAWIEGLAKQRNDFKVEIVDLKQYPLPFFAEEASPLYAASKHETAGRWQKKIAEFDAFIFTAAEYNHGPTAVLKNALDYAYAEWSNKPVAFIGYGGVGAARAIEQLRLSAIELQMAPIRTAVHILFPTYLAVLKEGKKLGEFEFLNQNARDLLDQLAWWTSALRAGREKNSNVRPSPKALAVPKQLSEPSHVTEPRNWRSRRAEAPSRDGFRQVGLSTAKPLA
jgi:NAD(P)H-dependent FMN reductase